MRSQELDDLSEKIYAVVRKHGTVHAQLPPTPLEEVIAGEEPDPDESEEWRERKMAVRVDTLRTMLRYIHQHGPDPLRILRNHFALTKAVAPELIGNMSLDDIAILCADKGKATVSARVKAIYNRPLERCGMDSAASFQKRGRYAEAQKGNQNRRKKKDPRKGR